MSTTSVEQDIEYPTGDGKPMAETPLHRDNMTETIDRLRVFFEGRTDVYVSGNMLVYYEMNNPYKHLSPDVMVVLDVPATERSIYCTWREPKPSLDLVIEFTSRSTAEEDLGDKLDRYARKLGVREYLLFDPRSEYLEPAERLFRLKKNGDYDEVEAIDGRLHSRTIKLHFERNGDRLALYDPKTKSYVPTAAERAEARESQERQRADRLAEENARLLAELEALRRKPPDDPS